MLRYKIVLFILLYFLLFMFVTLGISAAYMLLVTQDLSLRSG